MIKQLVVSCALLSATGCGLYWGDHNNNEDDDCNTYKVPVQEGRDPYDGACEPIPGGGGGGCGPCNPCPPTGVADGSLALPWAACFGACDGLAESACLSTAGCHAEYVQSVQSGSTTQFQACWDTLPGVQSTGTCAGLDGWTCANHDNCASVMEGVDASVSFSECIDETAGCGTCPTGTHCAQLCPPCNSLECSCEATCVSDTTCATTDCGPGYACETECDATNGCVPACVPFDHDPGACTGAVTCNSAPPACPTGTEVGIANSCYTGYCIPTAYCSSHDPGLCYATVTCSSASPACPAGTEAGVANGCYTGFCIPLGDCEAAACETLTTESACTGRSDCEGVYAGTDCTCEGGSCTCQTLTFESCMTAS